MSATSSGDALALVKTWRKAGVIIVSPGLASIAAALSVAKVSDSTISLGDTTREDWVLVNFSRLRKASLVAKDDALAEVGQGIASDARPPLTIGACLRLEVADNVVVFLWEV